MIRVADTTQNGDGTSTEHSTLFQTMVKTDYLTLSATESSSKLTTIKTLNNGDSI